MLRVGNTERCDQAGSSPDHQIIACLEKREVATPEPHSPPLILELYLKGGRTRRIEPGEPTREWRFRTDGQQVAVHSGAVAGPGIYAFYDAQTARIADKLAEPLDKSVLSQMG